MSKLFQICVEGNTGSTGRIAEAIGKTVISKGWESYIAFGRFRRPSNSKTIQIGSPVSVFFHGLQTRLLDRHGLGSRRATTKLIEQITAINPDVIHLHHLHGYYANIVVLFEFLSKCSKPVVWTFHDCWSFTGHCTHFDSVGCEKWKTECNNCQQLSDYPASCFIDRSKKNFLLKKELFNSVPDLTVVSVSYWLDRVVGDSFLKGVKRAVIYNGVNTDLFFPITNAEVVKLKYHVRGKFLILGVANTWSKRKGLDDFIELSKRVGEGNSIILVGLSESQIKNLPHNIIGLKRTETLEDLRDLYAAADVYINLSVEETFGLTTAEALACGTPAIVYNSTANPELIDPDTGILADKNDINTVCEGIRTIKLKTKEYYSNACRNRAVKYFNIRNNLAEHVKLYDALVHSNC